MPSTSCEPPSTLTVPEATTPRKTRLKAVNRKLMMRLLRSSKKSEKKKKQKSKQYVIDLLSEYVDGPALDFMKTQILMSDRKPKGNRWSVHDKKLALSLFYASPKCYKLLRKIFSLPCISSLKKYIRNLDVKAGFPQSVLGCLKIKSSSMSDESKLCVILFDEMSLKEYLTYIASLDKIDGLEDLAYIGQSPYVANHTSAFMLRGIVEKWKQPVGYLLSSGPLNASTLKLALLSCIEKVQSTGFIIKAVILDQGSNNRSMMTSLGVSPSKPFMMYKGSKLHVFYDPPHLLKNIRNNLKKTGFNVAGEPVVWKHIETFYEIDSSLPIRMAPKLTNKHINLPPFSSMNVRLASQVLSHSVAAGITTLCMIGNALPSEAIHTAKFIDMFDNIFNVFNSSSLYDSHRLRRAITATSDHVTFLKQALTWLDSVQLRTSEQKEQDFTPNNSSNAGKSVKAHTLPCLEGWKLSIQSLLNLWEELKTESNLKFLLTNRLNQDCVENLFSVIRGRGGHRDNPDPVQFRAEYRSVTVDHLFSLSNASNCKDDMDGFLLQLGNVTSRTPADSVFLASEDLPSSVQDLMSVSRMPPQFNLAEENIITYLAGYLSRKMLQKFSCDLCRNVLTDKNADGTEYTFLMNKQYHWLQTGGLAVPSQELVLYVSDMETLFREQVPATLYSVGIRVKFAGKAIKLTSFDGILCGKTDCQKACKYMTHLFFIVRIHHALGDINESFQAPGRKRNRKVLKLMHI